MPRNDVVLIDDEIGAVLSNFRGNVSFDDVRDKKDY